MSIPYAGATSGERARLEVIKILRRFGCEKIAFADYNAHEVVLAFVHRGREVRLRASAKGWAAMYLKVEPWKPSRRSSRPEWEQAALRQGSVAINSILRDFDSRSRAAFCRSRRCSMPT